MPTVFLPLNGDVETHGAPNPSGPIYLNIDEDPHDGDATRVRINGPSEVEASSVDGTALPYGIIISAVRVHWTAAGTDIVGDPSIAHAGLRIDGVDYWGGMEELSPHLYGGTFVEAFLVNPASGLPWDRETVAGLIPVFETTQQPSEPGWPRLTQRILSVDYELVPVRHDADGQSLAPHGEPAALDPEATAASLAPTGTATDLSPEADLTALAPTSQASSLTHSGDSESRAPMATAENLHELTATPSSLAPMASGVAIAPEATAEALAPGGTEET